MKKIILILIIHFCFDNTINAQIPTNGLVGYWPFSSNQLANDYSGNSNNGTITGAKLTTDRFDNCNQAYKFNGVNNFIIVPNSSTIDFNNTDDFTVALWLKTYHNDTNGLPLCKNVYGSWSGYLFYTNNSNGGYCTTPKHISFYVAAAAGGDACSNSAIFADTSWHFITGVYNHLTNQVHLYVDAVQQTSVGQRTANLSNTVNLVFGAHSNCTNLLYTGVLDAIRIYNRALSNAEITQLYNEPDPGSTSGIGIVKDTTVCTSSSAVLNAGTASSYTWSTGSNTQTITINNSGTYWVQIQPQNGCKQTDTIHVTFTTPPTINILKDTSACSNVSYVLNASLSNATSYHWSTSATSYSIAPSSNGTYWVDMSINHCTVRDSARINFINPPTFSLVQDTFICNTPIILIIKDTSLKVSWSTGSQTNQTSINSVGVYTVSVTKNGCTSIATVTVRNTEFITSVIIPNIITPNGDGINDFFEFNTNGLIVNEFNLYNRWGKQVYSTINSSVKWDGKQDNGLIDDGTYYWVAIFTNPCNTSSESIKQKGFLTVLK